MNLSHYVDTLTLLGDESRLRLCALLAERELCVTDLVRVTGIAQSRVSTHLGRLREAGLVRDRRQGAQSFYALAGDGLSGAAKALLDEATRAPDPTLEGDQRRLAELEAERRSGLPESAVDELERDYSPGRTWQSLAAGIAALLHLGDVLDVGSGDGAAASALAPYCRSLTCIDTNARMISAAKERLAKYRQGNGQGNRPANGQGDGQANAPRLRPVDVRAQIADVHALPFPASSFDSVLVFHTLTYAERPAQALAECARVLRPGGRLVLLCLDRHRQSEVTGRYGERHPGFSPRALRALLARAGLEVVTAEIACREAKKPHLQVVLAIGDKPKRRPTASRNTRKTN